MVETKTPVILVVRGLVGDPVRMIRQGKQMLSQLLKRNGLIDRDAVVQNMEVRFLEINDLLPLFVLYVSIPDIPLPGDRPVEHPGPRRNFVGLERYMPLKYGHGLSKSIPCYTPADRV